MSSREVLSVPISELHRDPEQVRTRFDENGLQDLARSLAAGQLQPILAYRRANKLVVLDGERRLRAGKLAGVAALDVLVVDDPGERGAILERQLVADAREDLNPMERARALKRLTEENGWTAARISARTGLSPATISRTLALLELPREVQAKVEKGDMTASAAYGVVKGGEGEAPRGAKKSKASETVRVAAALAGNRKITIAGPGLTGLDQLIAWLEELLQRAKKARPKGIELATFSAILHDEAKSPPRAK